jgi:hypothetical protein
LRGARSPLNVENRAKIPLQDFLVSANIPTGLGCGGLCCGGPLALMGIMCSGLRVEATLLANRAKAPPLAPSTGNRNPCWAVRVSHWHRQVCWWWSGGHLLCPRCLRSLQALSQDVPKKRAKGQPHQRNAVALRRSSAHRAHQLEDLTARTSSSSRCVPGSARRSKNASRLKREIEFDRRRPAQIQSTNHRHNYGQLLIRCRRFARLRACSW